MLKAIRSANLRTWYNLIAFFPVLLCSASCEENAVDDYVFPQLIAEDIIVDEKDETWELTVSVVLDKESEQNIMVNYATQDGSALSDKDYIQTSGTLTFERGQIAAEISIPILGNTISEEDKSFKLVFSNPINVSIKTGEITITLLNDDEGGGTSYQIPGSGYTGAESYDGYTLVWQDEFEGDELSGDWTFEIGTGSNGWGNNELQYYRKENTRLEDGYLIIEARRENFGGMQYTSSRLITMGKQSFRYGRIDIRAALPKGQGIWPALWMLGDNFPTAGWPHCGEIDIMEMIGGNANGRDNTVHGTIHWYENGFANYGGAYSLPSGKFTDNFHLFTIIWDESAIKWYVDDVFFHEVDIRPGTLNAFREKFFFIFNVAVGGNWPGNPDATLVLPQAMIVDYIRVFQVD